MPSFPVGVGELDEYRRGRWEGKKSYFQHVVNEGSVCQRPLPYLGRCRYRQQPARANPTTPSLKPWAWSSVSTSQLPDPLVRHRASLGVAFHPLSFPAPPFTERGPAWQKAGRGQGRSAAIHVGRPRPFPVCRDVQQLFPLRSLFDHIILGNRQAPESLTKFSYDTIRSSPAVIVRLDTNHPNVAFRPESESLHVRLVPRLDPFWPYVAAARFPTPAP